MCVLSTATTLVRSQFGASALDLEAFGESLRGLDIKARVAASRALTKPDQVKLWAACEGRVVTATDFIPEHVPDAREVIHFGRNTLPVFSNFQKRFTRAAGPTAKAGEVYGYNHNWHNWTTSGPGYFVGHVDPVDPGEFGLDYYHVPPSDAVLPAGWPKPRRNEVGLQRFIYARMVDYMRKVTDGVTIGRAWRNGSVTDNYFVLVRDET